jgi:uncharacterized protein YlxW (UPF0749 family)
MGASLLDAVLAETLDPAYARAAAAKTAEPPRSPWPGRALVALTMAVAGVLFAVTYAQAAAGAEGREEVRAALIDDIQRESEVSDDLTAQLEDLTGDVTSTRDQMLAASAVGQRALDELARAVSGAAAERVTGPGLLVTLANADPTADEDPVGGTTQEDPRGRVRDGQLQRVVNALWAAGAEAISINGQRLGPTTAIRFAGEAVLVDFRPVASPYEISAIGDAERMQPEFVFNPEIKDLASVSVSFGLRFDLARRDELTLPAAGTAELRSARALDAETTDAEGTDAETTEDAPATGTGAGTAPAPDPTPGG